MNRIDQRDITHKGRKLTVTVVRDDDGDPRTDGDCYTPDTVTVPVDTIAELIARARDDYQSGLEREAATWTAAVALIVSTDPARMTGVIEYLGFAITTEQPVSVDRVAAEHAIRLGASS